MRFEHPLLSSAFALLLASVAGTARAADCSEGDWFCEPPASPSPPEASEPGPAGPSEEPAAEPEASEPAEPRMAPFERRRIVLDQGEDRPRPRMRRWHRPLHPWGFDAHVFGAFLGKRKGVSSNTGMGGVGAGLRYRLMPEFAIEGDLELAFGTDYNGYDRQEGVLLGHVIGFFNPHSPIRAYVLGGFGLSSAHVRNSSTNSSVLWSQSYDRNYSYFGLDLGGGVEVNIGRRSALHAELIGFLRDRTGMGRYSAPEFVDDRGRTTNASGGGLLRIGAIFFW
jgi:hypothetical protein